MLDFGSIEETIVRRATQAGQPLPTNIQNAPELELGLQLYLQAFFDLDSERSHTFSLVRIPASKIRSYARELELDAVQSELLAFYISEMDGAHLKRLKAKENAGKP